MRVRRNRVNQRTKLGGKGRSDGAEAKDKNVSDEVLFAIPFQARLRRKERIPNVRPFTLVRSRPGIRGKCGPLLAAVR